MTDSQVLRLATSAEKALDRAYDLCKRIADSDHPNADDMRQALEDNCLLARWDVPSIVNEFLLRPRDDL
jgi:hypothetical protein